MNDPFSAPFRPQLNAERAAALKGSAEGHITQKANPREGPECVKK
jgi:hypothetical protein